MNLLSSTLTAVVLAAVAVQAAGGAAPGPFEGPSAPAPETEIDRLVFTRLEGAGIAPARLCSDSAFVRRVYLDVIGTLPTGQEAREFLQSKDPQKRRLLIDRLLERDEFADYWAMKWSDLLRVKAEFPINLWPNAAQAYHRWIRTSLAENMPYDRFVREMLTESGSNFRVPAVNFYRATQSNEPEALAQAVALTFMGARADRWPKDRLAGMAAFFAHIGYKATGEWKEEIILYDPGYAARADAGAKAPPEKGAAPAAAPVFPDGRPAHVAPGRDPREVFADWLIDPRNPWFARNLVNRVWSWLLGRGIIEEPDDLRPDNPPSNPELLAWLEKDFVASRYDLKRLVRQILNSTTYQLACIPQTEDPRGEALFAFYPLRRLEAEVLIDALCQVTGTTEQYSSLIPEPFTYVPENQRAITLPDGSITSSFLEMFGRPSRDTGMESERNNRPTAAQRLHLLNSSHVRRKIEQSPKLQDLIRFRRDPREAVAGAYLTILSRFPTQDELKIVQEYTNSSGGARGRDAMTDLIWALINSAEFLYRH